MATTPYPTTGPSSWSPITRRSRLGTCPSAYLRGLVTTPGDVRTNRGTTTASIGRQATRCTLLSGEHPSSAENRPLLPLPWSNASGDLECELGQAADAAVARLARRAAARRGVARGGPNGRRPGSP